MSRSVHFARWVLWLVVLLCSMPFDARAGCKLGQLEIPVSMVGTRAVARLKINGNELPFTVDSGAFFSAITEAAAEQLQLRTRRAPNGLRAYGLTGRVDYRVADVARLGFQNAEIPNIEFLVGGNEPGAGTIGLLGRNLLSWADAEYDLAHGAIRIMVPQGDCGDLGMAYWAGEQPVSIAELRHSVRDRFPPIKVRVKVNDHTVVALLDTGASSILSRSAAKKAGLLDDESRLVPAGPVHGAGRGELPSWLVPMASFEIGDERIANSRVRIADFDLDDADMLIGIDFFLSHRIFVATSQKRMYFTYQGGPVFDLTIKAATPAQPRGDEPEPRDAAAFARRGSAFAAQREHERALADFNRACELDPATGAYFRQRGTVRLLLRQPAEAMADFEEALRLDPSDHEARLDRARMNLLRRQTERTREDLRLLDEALAPQAHMRREMARLYQVLDEPRQVVAQLDRWIASHRREVDLHHALNSRCWARALLGTELDQALADCNEALAQKPGEPAYLDSRGLVHLRQGRWREARADYDEALKLRPDAAWTLLGRGLARVAANEREPGLADIAAARQRQPGIEADARRYGLELP